MAILSAEEFAKLTGDSTVEQVPASSSGKVMSADQFMSQFGDGEDLPNWRNGISPETPINASPISIEDRFKLSLGSESGNIKFLQENYGEVKRMPKSGHLVVKDKTDNLWKRVDPEGLGDGDPWEIAKDLADVVVPVGAIAAQIGVGIATGGASLPVQALAAGATGLATKGAETVIGKVAGTYEAPAEEQLKDIALEGLLNVGGTVIAAGVKPTVGFLAKKLKESAAVLEKAPEASRDALAHIFGMNYKGGARTVHTLIENSDDVSKAMQVLKNANIPEEAAKLEQIGFVKQMAQNIKQSTSNFFGRGLEEDVYKNLPRNFNSKTPQLLKEIEEQFFDNLGVTKINEEGVKVLLSKAEIAGSPRVANGELNKILGSDEAYQAVRRLWGTLKTYSNVEAKSGIVGAKDLIKVRRGLSREAFAQAQQLQSVLGTGSEAAKLATDFSNIVKTITAKPFKLEKEVATNFLYKENASKVIEKVMGGKTLNPLETLEQSYSLIKGATSDLRNAYNTAVRTGSDEVYENLVQKITSRLGTKAKAKTNLESSAAILREFGGDSGVAAANALKQIKVFDAAKDIMPTLKPGMIQVLASGGAIGSLVSGNEKMAGGFALTGALTSPRLTAALIRNSLLVPRFLKGISPAARKALINNPQALQQLANTVMNNEGFKNQVGSQLLQGAFQQIKGGNR